MSLWRRSKPIAKLRSEEFIILPLTISISIAARHTKHHWKALALDKTLHSLSLEQRTSFKKRKIPIVHCDAPHSAFEEFVLAAWWLFFRASTLIISNKTFHRSRRMLCSTINMVSSHGGVNIEWKRIGCLGSYCSQKPGTTESLAGLPASDSLAWNPCISCGKGVILLISAWDKVVLIKIQLLFIAGEEKSISEIMVTLQPSFIEEGPNMALGTSSLE